MSSVHDHIVTLASNRALSMYGVTFTRAPRYRKRRTASSRGGKVKSTRFQRQQALMATLRQKRARRQMSRYGDVHGALREQGFFTFQLFPAAHGLRLSKGGRLTTARLNQLTEAVIEEGKTFFQEFKKKRNGDVRAVRNYSVYDDAF